MPNPPSGTVTFLFTDIEADSSPCEPDSAQMQAALRRHEQILREAIEANGGYLYKTVGFTSQAAFHTAAQAAQAALDCQQTLLSQPWDNGCELRVKMALHSGVTEERGDDYVGPLLNRVARLLAAGHGGQVLLTQAAAMLLQHDRPSGASLEDLGEHLLKDLSGRERVYELSAAELGPSRQFPPLKTPQSRPTNLPVQPTPFLGRAREAAEVRDMLLRNDVFLLTLTGPGGIGKTRLALEVAEELLDEFVDGVFFVPLASLNDPSLLATSIAGVLDVREVSGQTLHNTLAGYLKTKHLLLVLDNFEHIMDANVQVASLLSAAPQLKVLVTSRASLRLSIQHEYPVPPMHVPGVEDRAEGTSSTLLECESVQLFVQRARSIKPGFELNDQNASIVAEICYRLEGIPLAIELAAARIKALSPQALLSRLDSRLTMLTGGPRDLHTRQQTLRNTIEWSYDLLTDGEKQLFRRMAAFRGGQTLEAIETVCALPNNSEQNIQHSAFQIPNSLDLLDDVSSLVDKSLMHSTEGPGGDARYTMLETINEYAWEKLREAGEASALQRRHALYFLRLAEEAEPELKGVNQARWLATLAAEHDNVRAALRWARETQHNSEAAGSHAYAPSPIAESPAEIGLRLAGAMWRFWYVRGYFSEGREDLAAMLALFQEITATRTTQASPGGELALSEAQKSVGAFRVKALNGAAVLASLQGDYIAARALNEEGLALARELGNKQATSNFLDNLGIMARQDGDFTTARSLYNESLALRRELGDKRGTAISLDNLGIVARQLGDNTTARLLCEESLALRRQIGDKHGIAFALGHLGNVIQSQGDYPLSRSLLEESLALRRELKDKRGIAIALDNLGNVVQLQGDYQAALLLYQEGLAVVRELGDKQGISYLLHSLGTTFRHQGDYASARPLYKESLALRREINSRHEIASSLMGLGGLAVASALATKAPTGGTLSSSDNPTSVVYELERGVKLLSVGAALVEALGSVLDTSDRLTYEQDLRSARAELGEELFDKALEEGRAMSMQAAIEYALEDR